MADPANVFALDDIRSITGIEVKPVVATKSDVSAAINRYYRADSDLDDLTMALDEEEDTGLDNLKEVVEDAPIVKFVNLLDHPGDQRPRLRHPPRADRARPARPVPHRRRAARDHALAAQHPVRRDQPAEDHGRHQHRRAPDPAGRPAVGRRPAARRSTSGSRPCRRSGARRSSCGCSTTRPRCSTLPTSASAQDNYERYSVSFNKPYGMILVTGPTGSGKSTTLYATLNIVSRPEINIITVEDPVEYRHPGHQPGADQPQGRPDLRRRAALDPAFRPRRRPDR